MLSGTVLLLLFLLLMFMGIPVAHSMIITAYITIKFLHAEIPTIIVPQRLFGGADNYILLCIPFFVLAGDLMSMTTLFDRLIRVANAMVGHIRGALSHITIMVSMFFAGITGAAVADTSAVGTVLIPAMVKQGYSRGYATALTVVASTIGVIIPPSNLMVVAALVSSSSVAALLLGGVIPGVLAGLSLLAVSTYFGIKYNFPKQPRLTWTERGVALWQGVPALGIPVVLMGGILSGIVTPTEAANISIVYALIVGPIMMRGFPPLRDIYKSSVSVCTRTSTVMFAVGASVIFGWILAIAQVPDAIAEFITSYTSSKLIIIAGMLFTYLAIGTFLDAIPIILIFTPIFLPLAEQLGIPVIAFMVTMVFASAMGLASPPCGSCLWVGAAIGDIQVERFTWELMPFLAAMTAILILIAYFPGVITILPDLMLGG
ncbi:MAG: TRAP transporter large permease [Candidatus Methylomirabilales bacterium]